MINRDDKVKKIVSFRGARIPQFEAYILQEIKVLTKKKFKKVKESKLKTKMGFSVKNYRVSGIRITNCGLTALPESIGELQSLQTLDLSGNKLTTLPESIGQMKALRKLNLHENKLIILPESITKLENLEKLNLTLNQLRTLPASMINISSLKHLYISNNPLDSKGKSVLKQLKKKGIKITN